MRAARFDVSCSFLEDMMHFPAESHIIGASFKRDGSYAVVTLTVDDPALTEADEPHDLSPVVMKQEWKWEWR